MRLLCVAFGISLVFGQDGVQDLGQQLQAEETEVEQQSVDGWSTTRWRRNDFPPLTLKEIEECGREIRMSMKCMCSLRDVSVDIPPTEEKGVLSLPRCATVKRCSGPCMENYMKCMPTAFKEVSVQVVKTDCRKSSVKVEAHTACQCTCMLSESDCNERQKFDRRACKCVCAKSPPCPPGTYFNAKTCRCECFESTSECSTGFQFNPATCECESENSIGF